MSSGAIALGRRQLGLTSARLKLEEKQAAAAVGQIRLAHAWKDVLDAHRLSVAQILLTFGDTEERRRYLNARNTLSTLLQPRRDPGDQRERHGCDGRDSLRRQRSAGGARRADDQRRLPGAAVGCRRAVHAPIRRAIPTRAVHSGGACASRRRSSAWPAVPRPRSAPAGWRRRSPPRRSRSRPAATCAVALGRELHPLRRIEAARAAPGSILRRRRRRCASSGSPARSKPAGELHVDEGAAAALGRGKSLLPAGVTKVVGRIRARRCLDRARRRAARRSRAACPRIRASTPSGCAAASRARSRRCSASTAATRSSIAMTW